MKFEPSIKRIEEIVSLLERGDAPLDKSLELFEEATALIRGCGELLDNAEQKVRQLSASPAAREDIDNA